MLRLSFGNASLLSAIYLVVATAVELIRRQWNFYWSERMALAFEMMPARTLDWCGLLLPLKMYFIEHQWPTWATRSVYGVTSVLTIFVLGFLVGTTLGSFVLLASPKTKNT
jgi:hypothetical protein